jgi:hydrophobic/amphiphilic exporter-1 (mainly G- bacteria), HAE1 family
VSNFERVVRRPVATWMIAIAAAVFGLVSYQRLPLNLMPDMAYPTLTVRTEVAGYAPEEVETQISRIIEEALATTPGLVELESRSRAGMSDVVLEFAWGTDMNKATQSVREQLQTTFLPDDADRPLILRFDPNLDPVMRIALSSGDDATPSHTSLLGLRALAEGQIKRRLEAMDGVASVRVRGGLERQIQIAVREDWMAARGVSINAVSAALAAENVNLPGGAILEGDHEYLVRTVGELQSIADISAIRIRKPDGTQVPLTEIAEITDGQKEREVVSRLDTQEAVELEVFKAADANIVHLSTEIHNRLGLTDSSPSPSGMPRGPPTIKEQLPEGVNMVVLEDQASFIEASIINLRTTAMVGALLAITILFLFLRDVRSTLVIATAIPLSIIVTFAPMYLGGVSLNLMSLGGLALGIGMLVDNAVIVLENIHVQRERGLDRIEAAISGTTKVAAAVVASTLTTVAVFLPIAFVEGVAGQLFGDLSLAVVFSLLASLVVALFFVPMLAAHELHWPETRPAFRAISRSAALGSWPQLKNSWATGPWWARPYLLLRFLLRLTCELSALIFLILSTAIARPLAWVTEQVLPWMSATADRAAARFQDRYTLVDAAYGRTINSVMRRPGRILGGAALAVVISIPTFNSLGQALIPQMHQGRFTAALALPVGTPLLHTIDTVAAIEAQLQEHPDIAHIHTVVGTERRADSRADEGEHSAALMIALRPGGSIIARERTAMLAVREAVAANKRADSLTVRMERPSLFSFRTPIEVIVFDRDLDRLRASADAVATRLANIDGLTDVRSSLAEGYPEVRINYDRVLLGRLGLTTSGVATTVRDKVLGKAATTISGGDGRIELSVRLDAENRRSIEHIKRININPEMIPPIPLSSVAHFSEAAGPSEIRRVDQRRAAVVSANMDGFDLSGMAHHIDQTLDDLRIESEHELGGQNREMDRSMGSMKLALMLAIFLVYVIMASTFESVLHPFVILLSVPLALIGVVGGLFLTGTSVSVVVLIGAIVLAGVVVNNAIVLVDTINQHRTDGMERLKAIQMAAQLRLRPILITTLTTILGLFPLAAGFGEGAEMQRPLALTIIAGLSSATLLTLGVIPAVYLVLTAALERKRP